MCEHCGCSGQSDKSVHDRVRDAIEQIRPYLQGHGGDIELVGVDPDNTVKVRLQGACSGCPGAIQTLKLGVERLLKQKVPQVKAVMAV